MKTKRTCRIIFVVFFHGDHEFFILAEYVSNPLYTFNLRFLEGIAKNIDNYTVKQSYEGEIYRKTACHADPVIATKAAFAFTHHKDL